MNAESIEQEALRLAPENRSEPEIEKAWLDEAELRARQFDDGTVQAIPAKEGRKYVGKRGNF